MIEGKKEYLLVKNNSKMIQTKWKSWQILFVNLETLTADKQVYYIFTVWMALR